MSPTTRSLSQFCRLFLCTSVVSLGVIYFMNAEVEAIRRKEADGRKLDNRGEEDAAAIKEIDYSSIPIRHSLFHTHFSNFYSNIRNSRVEKHSRKVRSVLNGEEDASQITKHHKLRHEQRNKNHAINNQANKGEAAVVESITIKEQCFGTDDVLVVVAITCLLNFSFVVVVWCSVRWVNSQRSRWRGKKRRRKYYKRRKNKLKGGGISWEEISDSDSSTFSSSSGGESEDDEYEQDNRLVKSYSMEDLRFYYG